MKAVIFDVDGTLANLDHRIGELPNWEKFFLRMGDDAPIHQIIWLNHRLIESSGYSSNEEEFAVLIVSARPDSYRQLTVEWLRDQGVQYDQMYMRQDGDFRQDTEVKRDLLEKIIDDGYEPWIVIDDRPEVVDMWRAFGITTLQCASDEVKLKHDGRHFFDILVGPAGGGKSTYCVENYTPKDIISTDQIREERGWGHAPDELAKTWRYAKALIKARIENHILTVLDATNIKRADRADLLRIVPRGQYVRYVVVDRRLEDKERTRGWRPESLILKHHRTMQSELKSILEGDGLPNVVVLDRRQK